MKHNTLAILTEDLGAESTELVQRFAQAGAFSKILLLHSDPEMRRPGGELDVPPPLRQLRQLYERKMTQRTWYWPVPR